MSKRKGSMSRKMVIRSKTGSNPRRHSVSPNNKKADKEGNKDVLNWSDSFLLKVALKECVKNERLYGIGGRYHID